MTESLLDEYYGSLLWIQLYYGTMYNGYYRIKKINIRQNKCFKFRLVLDSVSK